MLEFTIKFSRKTVLVLLILLVVPWVILFSCESISFLAKTVRTTSTHRTAVHQGHPGPWGKLQSTDVMIELPDEFIDLSQSGQSTNQWVFKGYTRDQIITLFRSANLPEASLSRLINETPWAYGNNEITIYPRDAQILELSSESRATIYSALISIPENAEVMDPVWFRPEAFDHLMGESGLSPTSRALMKQLLYHTSKSPLLLFADKDVALRQLPDDNERRLFIKTLARKPTLMVRLEIDKTSDAETLSDYWGVGGRRKDIMPLIESLQQVDGGWDLSLIYILPRFVRARLCTYPFPSTAANSVKEDCFWTAFNTFNIRPNDQFSDMNYVRKILDQDYYSIFEPSQLGDVILLTTSGNQAIHAAIYIADDIVFTKNGYNYTQPWLLMRRDDMIATYSARYPLMDILKPLYFRKRSL